MSDPERRYGERRVNLTLPKFRCPICGQVTKARVIDGRMNYVENYYWRKLRCLGCGDEYTSKEVAEALDRPTVAQHLVA